MRRAPCECAQCFRWAIRAYPMSRHTVTRPRAAQPVNPLTHTSTFRRCAVATCAPIGYKPLRDFPHPFPPKKTLRGHFCSAAASSFISTRVSPACSSQRGLRLQAQVVLQVGLDMPVPIPDLRVDEEGVFGTLSFKGVPFTCFVPWGAVFALVGEDAKGMVWSRRCRPRSPASSSAKRAPDCTVAAPAGAPRRLPRAARSQRPSPVRPSARATARRAGIVPRTCAS